MPPVKFAILLISVIATAALTVGGVFYLQLHQSLGLATLGLAALLVTFLWRKYTDRSKKHTS